MHRERGFTLIELVIVLGIILVIAAIAIPSVIGAKIKANETSAIAAIKTIETAQASYETTYPTLGYASSLAELGGPDSCKPAPENACLIDEVLTDGEKSGYVFTVVSNRPARGAATSYVVAAAPLNYNRTGARRFCATRTRKAARLLQLRRSARTSSRCASRVKQPFRDTIWGCFATRPLVFGTIPGMIRDLNRGRRSCARPRDSSSSKDTTRLR